jgi:HK97 family phage major capsid protein
VLWPSATIKNSNVKLPKRVADAAHSAQDLTKVFGKTKFVPIERSAIFKIPVSLIEDEQFDVLGWLIGEIGLEVGEIKETDYLFGNGAEQCLGLLSDKVGAVIAMKDIAGSTNAIVAEDLIKACYAMRMSHRRGAAIMMHRNTVLAIRLMRDNIGGAGTGQFLWQPGLTVGAPAMINGLPLMESEFFTDPYAQGAADGDAMLLVGNFKSYWIVNRLDLSVQRLDERYADEAMVGLVFRLRYDAAPVRAESFVRLNRQ